MDHVTFQFVLLVLAEMQDLYTARDPPTTGRREVRMPQHGLQTSARHLDVRGLPVSLAGPETSTNGIVMTRSCGFFPEVNSPPRPLAQSVARLDLPP